MGQLGAAGVARLLEGVAARKRGRTAESRRRMSDAARARLGKPPLSDEEYAALQDRKATRQTRTPAELRASFERQLERRRAKVAEARLAKLLEDRILERLVAAGPDGLSRGQLRDGRSDGWLVKRLLGLQRAGLVAEVEQEGAELRLGEPRFRYHATQRGVLTVARRGGSDSKGA